MIRREHLAGAPDAALHFVEDERNSVSVAESAKRGERRLRRNDVSTRAEDRFDEERRNLSRIDVAAKTNRPRARQRCPGSSTSDKERG